MISSSEYAYSMKYPEYQYTFVSSIALGKSTRLHPVSVLSWCMKFLSGWPTLGFHCVEVLNRTSVMSSSLLLQ